MSFVKGNPGRVWLVGFVLLILAFILPSLIDKACAQEVSGFAEYELSRSDGSTTPEINVYAKGPLAGRFGWMLWTEATSSWGESMLGVTFAPKQWIEVSGTLGVETDADPLRGGFNLWLGGGRFAFLSNQENGGSGYWQKNVGTLQIARVLLLGVLQQTAVGTGPYAELRVGRLSLWSSYAPKDRVGLLTLQARF